ncbi:Hypothetical protein CINCED_3A016564 [Cinara cedri]|uniref:Uncharacterized protein n=1 Tax=Cinara cedri TaxID=506608 RepID=A0A5E4MFA2_9HEMI|nr:Hypothetical protein CINCED_3A016564 [Cinara cedri]
MESLNDIEATCVMLALYKKHKRKQKRVKWRHWIHPLNLKRPENGVPELNAYGDCDAHKS